MQSFKLQKANSLFYIFPFLNPLRNKTRKLPQTQTPIFRMVTQSGSSKRPTCPSCCKPTRICLCNRLQTPPLDNSVNVTILQHSLEKKHPLNSTRIATIGLKHVHVVTVSDVNFEARFFIRLLDSSREVDPPKMDEGVHLFDEMPSKGKNVEFVGNTIITDSSAKECKSFLGSKTIAFNFTIGKYGAMTSSDNKCEEVSLDKLLASNIALDDIREGFVVKKLGKKLLEGSHEYEENEEFDVMVPPGSVLLFPSETSVDVKAVNFEVKNLIVLDGTWAKAKRMYNENPWLRLLPHVRLDVDRLSLYSEVRHQPRVGYLSTIESIVYAMKAFGEESEGLDSLLDVFESMVGDQRRCKDERLSKAS